MKGWDELGVVDTIYEEEEERDPDASRSLSLTPSITASPTSPRSTSSLLSPSPTSLNARVEECTPAPPPLHHLQSILLDQPPTPALSSTSPNHPHRTSKPPSTLGAILQRDAILRNSSHLRSSIQATSFRIESLERDLDGLRRKLRWSEEKGSSSFRVVGDDGARGGCVESGRRGKGIGRKLLDGFKSVFKTLPSSAAEVATAQRHRRNNSFA
ncbi:uncharacterized protein A4U43_C08F12300 [Asparagus officinalis]|nr:uncharacterized protein A4U43_C08F12300 [Asparagus officinalis]